MTLIPYELSRRTLLALFTLLVSSFLVFQARPQPIAASDEPFLPAGQGPISVAAPTHPGSARSNLVAGDPKNQIPLPDLRIKPKKKQTNAAKILSDLGKSGPVIPAAFSMSDFSVQGLVNGGWPLVVQYELEADSTAEVTISTTNNGKLEIFPIQLPPTNGERGEVEERLPEAFGQKPQLGVVSFKAFKNGPEPRRPASLFLSALGVGPGAVGSVVIVQVQFQPPRIRPKLKEKASYSFHSLSDFNNFTADFSLATRAPDGSSYPQLAYRKEFKNGVRPGQTVKGDWDGKNSKGKTSVGPHQFHVRAWSGLKSGGHWAFAAERQLVRVERE